MTTNQVVTNSKSDETWAETRSQTYTHGILVVSIISLESHNGQDPKEIPQKQQLVLLSPHSWWPSIGQWI